MAVMLLERAGFAPSHEGPTLMASSRRNSPMQAARWHLFRVRPENHPRRRIKGAASLLDRHLKPGLAECVVRLVQGGTASLEKGLVIAVPEGPGPALIGQSRARDLAVNVVLPFAHALAFLRREAGLAQACWSLYHRYPKLQ